MGDPARCHQRGHREEGYDRRGLREDTLEGRVEGARLSQLREEQVEGGAHREGEEGLSESDLERVTLQRVETRNSLAPPRTNSE